MKKNQYIGMMMMAATMLVATSCSDFDDYNKAAADATASGNQTLWENINQNPQLSVFASLIQKSGFNKELSESQYYTVWAPLDGTFDATPFLSMKDDALMRQFVKNHIASYGHQASGNMTDRIFMLNEKSYDFTGNTTYQFDGIELKEANIPSNNGILHTINGVAAFYPNLYEYITDTLLSKDTNIDSLRNYVLRFENTYLDTERSIAGPIVNGMQTYVDSVIVKENALWETLNIKMNNEDSTYTFIMPTNEAWKKTYNKIQSNFKYIETTNAQSFNGSSIASVPASIKIDPTYWQDSITNRYLTRYLTFSNNNGYNKWLVGSPSYLGTDTLYTTTHAKLSNPNDILAQTSQTVKMSNGVARIVDSLAIYPWETYSGERIISATNSDNQARIISGNGTTMEVSTPNPEVIDLSEEHTNTFRYLWVEPSGGYAKPELDLYLPNVQSTTYEFYCVFVPQSVDITKKDIETKPNRVIFTLNYCDANGALKDYVFLDEKQDINAFKTKYNLADNATNKNTIRAFSNDTSKVDTLYLGEFTFPVSYFGLGKEYCPNIKITSPFSAVTGTVRNDFTRDLRIAAIILRPKELVEFEESNKN